MSSLSFTCNVCGKHCENVPIEHFGRETPSCSLCGSTVRMRSIVHILSLELYGESKTLEEFIPSAMVAGVGLSDWNGYADRIKAVLPGYSNTYYHQEPFLDICNVGKLHLGRYDFLISTEVFEHVPPPAESAFKGAFDLLKPGGFMVFTVPYNINTDHIEHFPDLQEYGIVKLGADFLLVNRGVDGAVTVRGDLVFHGGPGETLEMRVFSQESVESHLRAAGFEDITLLEDDVPEMGIIFKDKWSLPFLARKPLSHDGEAAVLPIVAAPASGVRLPRRGVTALPRAMAGRLKRRILARFR